MPVTNLSNSYYSWRVFAKINDTSSMATIILQNNATVGDDGSVVFDYLGISIATSNLHLAYYLESPYGINA